MLWLRAAFAGLLPALLVPCAAVRAGEPDPAESRSSARSRPDCEFVSGWDSRHHARTPTSRLDCVNDLLNAGHELRVSHLQRGLSTGTLSADEFTGDRRGLRILDPGSESLSSLELSGSASLWSYETELDLRREAHFERGRLLPEGRMRLRLQTGLDLGLVRPRVEFVGDHREDETELATALRADSEGSSRAGGRALVDVVLPSLPVLTLAVGREQKLVYHGGDLEGEEMDSDGVSAALWYGRSTWQAYAVSSAYSLRGDRLGDAGDSLLYDHFVSGSYYPTSTLTLSPSLQYSEATYDGRESWSRTLSASLGLYSTGVWEQGLVSLWTGYDQSRDTADRFDYRQLHLALGAERALASLGWLEGYGISIGGSLGYTHYLDRIHPDASGPNFSTLLTLRISAPR